MRTHDHSFLRRAALVLAATILVSVTAAPIMAPTTDAAMSGKSR